MAYILAINTNLPYHLLAPLIEVKESDAKGATELTTAFRKAKLAAGWEVEIPTGCTPPIQEPVCRNLRSEYGAYEART